jgi:hypothetical protein
MYATIVRQMESLPRFDVKCNGSILVPLDYNTISSTIFSFVASHKFNMRPKLENVDVVTIRFPISKI